MLNKLFDVFTKLLGSIGKFVCQVGGFFTGKDCKDCEVPIESKKEDLPMMGLIRQIETDLYKPTPVTAHSSHGGNSSQFEVVVTEFYPADGKFTYSIGDNAKPKKSKKKSKKKKKGKRK